LGPVAILVLVLVPGGRSFLVFFLRPASCGECSFDGGEGLRGLVESRFFFVLSVLNP
jgi:hypothetical protein